MQPVKSYRKQSLILFFLSTLFLNHSPVFAETVNENHTQAIEWSGIYNGFLPCNDCQGIKTTLALNNNNSYILISQQVGKSVREIVEKGKFVWGNAENTLVLTPRKAGASHQYFVGKNQLIQLDDSGHRYTGKEAERYILHRTSVIESTPSTHSGHH